MGFGVLYLKRRIAEATPQRRAEVERALAGYAATIGESVLWRDPVLPPPPERWDVRNANAAFGEFMLKNLTGRLRQIGLKLAA
jgi:hypothetical protein